MKTKNCSILYIYVLLCLSFVVPFAILSLNLWNSKKNTQSVTGYTENSTGYTESIKGYTDSFTGYNKISTEYTVSSTGYTDSSTVHIESSTAYAESNMEYTDSTTDYTESTSTISLVSTTSSPSYKSEAELLHPTIKDYQLPTTNFPISNTSKSSDRGYNLLLNFNTRRAMAATMNRTVYRPTAEQEKYFEILIQRARQEQKKKDEELFAQKKARADMLKAHADMLKAHEDFIAEMKSMPKFEIPQFYRSDFKYRPITINPNFKIPKPLHSRSRFRFRFGKG